MTQSPHGTRARRAKERNVMITPKEIATSHGICGQRTSPLTVCALPNPCKRHLEHDHGLCLRNLKAFRETVPLCHIEEDPAIPATHALNGVAGGIRLYCDPCFEDVYGPHNCERLACKENPCPLSGKLPEEE
jgi:hypothetical protein